MPPNNKGTNMYETPSSSSNLGDFAYKLIGYAISLTLFFITAEAGGCSVDAERFQNAARNEGLTDAVQGSDYDYFECGSGDWWVDHIDAKRGDVPVSGTVCCGILKGCTIRWE